jgi:acetyltransferase-like isoleucine patch superfamily enzyme
MPFFERLRRVWRNLQLRLRRTGLNEYTNAPLFRAYGLQVGDGCRIFSTDPNGTFGSEPYLIRIGDHVTVTADVKFITHDGGTWVFRREDPDFDAFGPIEVKDNVFIGVGAIIMPGVTIGENCVIGARSVVSTDIPPNSVAAGVPARVLMSLEEYRAKKLLQRTVVRGLPPVERRALLMRLWGSRNTKS